MYHRVVRDYEEDGFGCSVVSATQKNFEGQMKFLAEEDHNVISLEDFVERMGNGKKLPKNSIVITFDDGYKDNFFYAYPILKKYKLPATFFLTTGFLDNKTVPWWDKLIYLVKNSQKEEFSLDGFGKISIRNNLEKKNVIKKLWTNMRVSNGERGEYMEKISEELKVELPKKFGENLLLSREDIKKMSREGMSFGAHTESHPILSQLPENSAKKEILDSKKKIEEELQREVNFFAYPNGRRGDFNPKIKRILKENGFKAAVSTIYGFNYPGQDLFELKRIGIHASDNLAIFQAKLLGLFNFLG